MKSGSKSENSCPRLELEADSADPHHFHLRFYPDPAHWHFDDTRGTREQLRADIYKVVTTVVQLANADSVFDTQVQQQIRTQVLATLLYWTACRGLLIPAGT